MSLNKLLIERSIHFSDYTIDTYSDKNIMVIVTKEQLEFLLKPHDAGKGSQIDFLIIDKKIVEELRKHKIGQQTLAALNPAVKKWIEI